MMIDRVSLRQIVSAVFAVTVGGVALLVACESPPPVEESPVLSEVDTLPSPPGREEAFRDLRRAVDIERVTRAIAEGQDRDLDEWAALRARVEAALDEHIRAREAFETGEGPDPGEFTVARVTGSGLVPADFVPDTYFRNVPDTVRLEFLVRELEIRYPNLKILSAGRTPAGRLVVRFDSIPGIGTVELSDFEIEDPRLEALNMEALLPPAPDPVLEEDPGPQFTPFDKAPALANRADMLKALMLEYPPVLKDAGIAGDVVLHFHIGSDGRVIETVLAESSGHTSMDEAAQRVAGIMEFNPAGNLGQDVAVWVQLTVKFTTS